MKEIKLISFDSHLKELKKDNEFKEGYEIEKKLLEIALKINSTRNQMELSKKELSQLSGTTPKQIAKLERGENCSINTYFKVCKTLGLKVEIN